MNIKKFFIELLMPIKNVYIYERTHHTDLKMKTNLRSATEGAGPSMQNSHLRVGDVNKRQACFIGLYRDELPVCLS